MMTVMAVAGALGVVLCIIGCILCVYGYAKEPAPTKEELQRPFNYAELFHDVFTDSAKRIRKVGIILCIAGTIPVFIQALLT